MRFLPVNLNTIIVELANLDETLALFEALAAKPIAGIEEMVPAANTIMIQFAPTAISAQALVRQLRGYNISTRQASAGKLVEIPVYYNGEDLSEVASFLGISTDEVIARHTGGEYSVAFIGFAPGFAYLSGGHPSFQIPRRQTPRTRIPAGAVAVAGNFSAVYPKASPGGWQILGVTPSVMWDMGRDVPALLQPGFKVKFVDAGPMPAIEVATQQVTRQQHNGTQQATTQQNSIQQQATQERTLPYLSIGATGIQTLLQDLGRPNKVDQGVATSGALDRGALKAANRLVGSASDAACLEVVYGGLRFTAHGAAVIAVTGAPCPVTIKTADGRQITASAWTSIDLDDGDTVTLGMPDAGIRSYVAVRGGFDVAPVMDSLSTDTLAQVGPAPVAKGDVLGICQNVVANAVSLHEEPPYALPKSGDVVVLDVVMGPRTDWFTEASIGLLAQQEWQVTAQSSRVGIRLAGNTPLARVNQQELPSEGTSVGAIQVPMNGQPVLFLADHPLTGGYPVIGAVANYHLDLAGQIPVNARIRFNPITQFAALSAD